MSRDRRFAAAARLGASLVWLAFAVFVFRHPLDYVLRPVLRASGLESFFHPADSGFVLRITSRPPGARLTVDGVDQGRVPLMTNVACREGEAVRLDLVREGFRPWQRQLRCREGLTLLVRARLVK